MSLKTATKSQRKGVSWPWWNILESYCAFWLWFLENPCEMGPGWVMGKQRLWKVKDLCGVTECVSGDVHTWTQAARFDPLQLCPRQTDPCSQIPVSPSWSPPLPGEEQRRTRGSARTSAPGSRLPAHRHLLLFASQREASLGTLGALPRGLQVLFTQLGVGSAWLLGCCLHGKRHPICTPTSGREQRLKGTFFCWFRTPWLGFSVSVSYHANYWRRGSPQRRLVLKAVGLAWVFSTPVQPPESRTTSEVTGMQVWIPGQPRDLWLTLSEPARPPLRNRANSYLAEKREQRLGVMHHARLTSCNCLLMF